MSAIQVMMYIKLVQVLLEFTVVSYTGNNVHEVGSLFLSESKLDILFFWEKFFYCVIEFVFKIIYSKHLFSFHSGK